MSQHRESLQLHRDSSWTGMNVMNFSSMVLNTEGKGDTPLSSEHQILYLSLLQPSEHSVPLFFLHQLDKKYFFSELLEIKDPIFQFSVMSVVS